MPVLLWARLRFQLRRASAYNQAKSAVAIPVPNTWNFGARAKTDGQKKTPPKAELKPAYSRPRKGAPQGAFCAGSILFFLFRDQPLVVGRFEFLDQVLDVVVVGVELFRLAGQVERGGGVAGLELGQPLFVELLGRF